MQQPSEGARGRDTVVPRRWRHAADHLAPLSGRYLSFAEREEIALLHAQQLGVREIARRIGRHPSTFRASSGATRRPVATS